MVAFDLNIIFTALKYRKGFNMKRSNMLEEKMTLDQYVIDVVTELRKSRKITQREIAEAIKVSGTFIGNVESRKSNARYNLKHINLLASYFNLSPHYFFPDKALR